MEVDSKWVKDAIKNKIVKFKNLNEQEGIMKLKMTRKDLRFAPVILANNGVERLLDRL